MSNKGKFYISVIITSLVAIGLIVWSYHVTSQGRVSIVSPIAVLLFQGVTMQILAAVFKVYKKDGDKKG